MTEHEFSEALAKALRLCREAAALKLPIEEMLEHLDDVCEARGAYTDEDAALLEIISAVADVTAIGAKLPPEPGQPAEPTYPLPGNLREA